MALVTAAGLAVYVLGLVGLAISIRLRFKTDVSVAWYAVSLLPRTIVAGQGVRVWLGWPIILTAAVLPATFITGSFLKFSYLLVGIVIVAALVDLFVRTPIALLRMEQHKGFTYSAKNKARFFAGSLVMGLGSLVMIGAASIITQQAVDADVPVLAIADATTNNRGVGVLLLFVGGFFVGLPIAAGVSPPLPWVKIAKHPPEDAKKGGIPSVRGYLVSHSDGFWHLFDKNNQLLSIPDEQILDVRIVGKDPSESPSPRKLFWKSIWEDTFGKRGARGRER